MLLGPSHPQLARWCALSQHTRAGFAIGSAALVSLALFGAYITRCDIGLAETSLLDPRVFCGLLVGAMLPYWFSAMTMKSVGKAALAMVEEVRSSLTCFGSFEDGVVTDGCCMLGRE